MTLLPGSQNPLEGASTSQPACCEDLGLLTAVFNTTSALLIILDSDGFIQRWNPACEALTGYSLAEVRETPFFNTFIPHGEPRPADTLRAMMQTGSSEPLVCAWRMKDGANRWISWTTSVYQGNLLIATGIDITGQRDSDAALADTRIRERKILETLPIGIWVTDPSGAVVLSNPEGQRLWGSASALEEESVALDPSENGWQMIRSQDAQREVWSDDEVEFEDAAGASRVIQTQSIALYNDLNQQIGSMMLCQDITSRKRAEEHLRQNENRARILAEISQALADVSLDYQAVLDTTIERVTALLGDLGTIQTLTEERDEIVTESLYHTDPDQRSQARDTFLSSRVSAATGIRAQVISSGLPMLIQQIDESTLAGEPAPETLPYLTGERPANLLIVPLRVHADAFGLLTLSRQQTAAPFTVDDLNFVLELAERSALAIENARLYSDNLRQREELEVRVARRTSEISVVNQYLQLQLRERARVEEELGLFFDVALDMLCIATFDGYLTRVSPSWSNVLGWTAEELTTIPYIDLVHPDDHSLTLKANASLAAGNVVIGLDNRYRCKNGSYRWISWNSVGLPERGIIISAARDITERKEAENRLSDVLELNQKIIANAPVGILAYRPNGECILANETSARIVGATLPQVTEQNFFSISSWQRSGLLNLAETVLKEGIDQHTEIHTITAFNHEAWLECFLTSFHRGGETNLLLLANDITGRKKVEDEMQFMATHDPLTGLPNRNLFQDRLDLALARARRYNQGVAVMILDLDHFKHVNDSYGHPTGDELLKIVAQRLSECLRKSDTVARMGGDEFTFIFPDYATVEHIEVIAQKVLATVSQPVELNGVLQYPTASLGISLFPQQGSEGEVLLKKADIAMYQAKQTRNSYQIYAVRPFN